MTATSRPSRRPPRPEAPGEMHALGPYGVPGLDGVRGVRVYVPRGHDRSRPAPVLVLFDGQNVFDDAPSYAGGWHVHEAVDGLSARSYVRPIVVGVNHGGATRIEELGRRNKTDRLLTWIGDTLLPEVRARFGGREGPVGTAIGGSSMGGLASLYAHFRRPDLFGGVISMSPSLWYARGALFPFIAGEGNPYVSRIYLDAGVRESGGRIAEQTARMGDHLRSRGYGPDALYVRIDPRGTHAERHWRRRMPRALRFMYRR